VLLWLSHMSKIELEGKNSKLLSLVCVWVDSFRIFGMGLSKKKSAGRQKDTHHTHNTPNKKKVVGGKTPAPPPGGLLSDVWGGGGGNSQLWAWENGERDHSTRGEVGGR